MQTILSRLCSCWRKINIENPWNAHLTTIIVAFATKTQLVWYWKNKNEWKERERKIEKTENKSFSQPNVCGKKLFVFCVFLAFVGVFASKIPHKINYWISSWWMKIKLWVCWPRKHNKKRLVDVVAKYFAYGEEIEVFFSFSSTSSKVRCAQQINVIEHFVVVSQSISWKKSKRINYKHPGHEFWGFFLTALYFFFPLVVVFRLSGNSLTS